MNTTHLASLLVILGSLTAGVAHAEETPEKKVEHRGATERKARRHHVRMGLELVGMMAIGHKWYWRDNGKPNEVDWQMSQDLSAAGTKLTSGDAWRFDGNDYELNALGHPGFGLLTHVLARHNNYSVAESFVIGTLTSGTWEVFLELAEYGSINDAITTSPAGVPLGESVYQIARHLDETDFVFRAGAGTDNGAGFAVVSASADLDRTPTRGNRRTYAGQAVSAGIEATADETVRSVEGSARASLAGYRRNRADSSLFTGLTTAFDFRDRADRPEHAWDRLTTVAAGPTVAVQVRKRGVTVDVGADAFLDFAIVKSQAFDTWRTEHPTETVRNSMQGKDKPVYYAYGGTITPHVSVAYRNLQLGGKVAASRFGSIDGVDRDQEMLTSDVHFTDTDATAASWLGYQHRSVSLMVDGRVHRRGGSAGDVEASTTARTAMLTVAYAR